MHTAKHTAFTLIELLIVVAIIAILAAIAVPNFLEAQVRSKVSRAKSDLRSLATAVESYSVDHGKYPMDRTWFDAQNGTFAGIETMLYLITTPVAYMTSLPKDTFPDLNSLQYHPTWQGHYYWVSDVTERCWISYFANAYPAYKKQASWALVTRGPDRKNSIGEFIVFGQDVLQSWTAASMGDPLAKTVTDGSIYDATNGTVSWGDIVRIGP